MFAKIATIETKVSHFFCQRKENKMVVFELQPRQDYRSVGLGICDSEKDLFFALNYLSSHLKKWKQQLPTVIN